MKAFSYVILNLDARGEWSISRFGHSTPVKQTRYPLNGRLRGAFKEEKNLVPLPRLEPRIVQPEAVTIPTERSRLLAYIKQLPLCCSRNSTPFPQLHTQHTTANQLTPCHVQTGKEEKLYAYILVSMFVNPVYSGLRPLVITHFNTTVSTFHRWFGQIGTRAQG
jgi:hypothetical protein